MAFQIQLRRGTASEWTSANPTLAAGEFGYESDTSKLKIGDGLTAWSSLAYFTAGTSLGTMTGVDITAGDGLDISQSNTTSGNYTATVSADLKANGGIVVESTELAVDLGASSITGTLAAADGGTGLTSISTLLNSNTTKSDVGLGNVENTALSTWAGSGNITQVGTITSGTWNGTAIAYSSLSGNPTLGTASQYDAGTGPNDIVQLDGSSRLPAVDGSQLTNLPVGTSLPASGLTSGSLSIDLIPNADGTLDLGSADYRWAEIHGDLEGSVMFRAKNGNASALSVGDVVYISGYTSGTTPDVDFADADDAAKMPSFGVISTGGNSGAEVYVTTFGTLDGLDLPSGTYSAGDEIFVSTTAGDFTNTAPTGESAAIQKIGFVIKENTGGGTNGSIKVLGAGRSNATPNLDSGKIFYGNGSNQAVSTTLTSVAEAAGAVSTHAAVTSGVHGISSFGATLVDDADAAAARTTLGATTVGTNVFTAASQAAARSAIGAGTGDMVGSNNLSDLANAGTARTNLGATTVGANVFTAADQAAARSAIGVGTGTGDLVAANNLSDLADAATARINLGLGSSSTLDVPSSGDAASGEVVKGNDTRLTDARTPVAHSAALITSGTLAIAQGGTGSATAPMVGVITAADAAAARTVLSLGTAATSATGDFEASGSIATHNAVTTAHGISAFGSTLVDDADAATARTTLGAAASNHTHTLANITDAGTAAASATTDFVASTDVSAFGGTLIDDADAAAARTTLGVTNTGSYTGQIETAADKDYILDPAVATARTISAFYIKVNSGSGTAVAKLYNGSDLVKQVTASTSTANQTSLANTSLAADAVLKLELSAASATDVIFSVEYTE